MRRRLRRIGVAVGAAGGAGLLGASWWLGGRLTAPLPASVGPPPSDFPVEQVAFDNDAGQTVHGWFHPPAGDAGTVVLLHSLRRDRRAMLRRARALGALGLGALLVDLRAHGESLGERVTFGLAESADARAAVDFVRRRTPGKPLGAIGCSLGGAAALLGSAPIAVDALVVEGVYPSIAEAIEARLAMRLGRIGARLATPIFLAQIRARLGVAPAQLRPIDQIRHVRCPLLVVAGAQDPKTPLAQSRRLFSAAPESKELWIVEGAGHQDFLEHDPEGYQTRVFGFLKRHL